MKYFFYIGLIVTWSFNALAESKSVGCGIGNFVAPKNSMVSATTRVSVNYILPSTFSMSSGTSGCAVHSIVKNEKRAIHFAEVNYASLELEMAQGQGEFLSGWASVLGCQQEAFGRATQTYYNQLVPSSEKSPTKLLDNVQNLIRTSPDLAEACQADLT